MYRYLIDLWPRYYVGPANMDEILSIALCSQLVLPNWTIVLNSRPKNHVLKTYRFNSLRAGHKKLPQKFRIMETYWHDHSLESSWEALSDGAISCSIQFVLWGELIFWILLKRPQSGMFLMHDFISTGIMCIVAYYNINVAIPKTPTCRICKLGQAIPQAMLTNLCSLCCVSS
jgi:hypothetical protein